jgi:hypothetical protein
VKTWLFTTLHREFLGSRRRQTRFPHIELEAAESELPEISPVAVNRLDVEQLMTALGKVDELYQGRVALFYLQDHSYKEIAEILEVPIGTVKSRLARGLLRLQLLLTYAGTQPPIPRYETKPKSSCYGTAPGQRIGKSRKSVKPWRRHRSMRNCPAGWRTMEQASNCCGRPFRSSKPPRGCSSKLFPSKPQVSVRP